MAGSSSDSASGLQGVQSTVHRSWRMGGDGEEEAVRPSDRGPGPPYQILKQMGSCSEIPAPSSASRTKLALFLSSSTESTSTDSPALALGSWLTVIALQSLGVLTVLMQPLWVSKQTFVLAPRDSSSSTLLCLCP